MKSPHFVQFRGLFALLLLFGLHQSVSGQAANVPSSLTVTAPGGTPVTLAEIDEFSTTVLGDPWDMNEKTDLAYFRTESQLTNSLFSNGIYSARQTNGNGSERITLLTAGSRNNAALRIGKIGYNFPINADHYRFLTVRLYQGSGTCASGLVQWFANDSYTNAALGISNSFSVGCNSGWGTYVIDLKSGIQAGSQPWTGTIRELILKPYAGAGAAGSTVKLDWARLTAANPLLERPFTIRWNGNGNGGPVSLYASPNDRSLGSDHDILIATDQSANGGSFTFQTGVLPAGTYYIAATNGSGTFWSQAPLVINAPPQTTITKPSKTSGADYATTEKGNAWDMSQANDLNDSFPIGWETCTTGDSFSGGQYHATNVACSDTTVYSDPKLIMGHMNPSGSPDPVVDTNKYRYLSFRFLLDGQQNVAEGWIARWGWWQLAKGGLPGSSTVMSRDIILIEDWNTYKIDLWANDIVDEAHPVQRSWQNSAPNRLRFDPTELNVNLLPRGFHIDWFKLTAMDEVNRNATFPIEYTLDTTRPTTLTFYYDTDTNPNNGRSLIGSRSATGAATTLQQTEAMQNDHMVYLPLILNNTVNCVGDCFNWNTSGVAPGVYYICVDSNDELNATYRCSEAPMRVN
ncbi:MAG: hypothetical protein AAF614_30680 [Chloroflexota bacterium]